MMGDLNYFVCTLGQAVKINQRNPHQYSTINEFIDHQAHNIPDRLAVAFPVPKDGGLDVIWASKVFTFRELRSLSIHVAQKVSTILTTANGVTQSCQTFALLCSSSVEFLFAWLGLLRLGHSVILIAMKTSVSTYCNLSPVSNL